jgi:hypothetical protein
MKQICTVDVEILIIYCEFQGCHNAKLSHSAKQWMNEWMKKLAETPFDKNESLVN